MSENAHYRHIGFRAIATVGLMTLLLVAGAATAFSAPTGRPAGNPEPSVAHVGFRAEAGILAVLRHEIQFGEDGDPFDYREQGGQEIVVPYQRFTAEALFAGAHELELLYQPLTIDTRTAIPAGETIRVDDEEFGTEDPDDPNDPAVPLDLRYGFDFWRATYRYRFADTPSWTGSAGAGLQLRNASIIFESADGEQRVVSQDLGPVPVISTAARYDGERGGFLEMTAEGFWAPIRYLNLRDVDVNGWLYDVAFRAGVAAREWGEAFVGIRALGGGSDGTGPERSRWTQTREEPRYTYNNLNTLALTVGARL